jgi:hypothetical protein
MYQQLRKMTIALALVSLVFMTAASAAITGDLKTGSGGTVTVTLTSITFNSDPGSNPPGPPWNGEVASGTSLRFAGCPSGVLGTAGCLNAAPYNPNEAIKIANGVPITLSGGLGPNNPFLSFAGNGISHTALLYTVLSLGPGSANTNCLNLTIGNSCSLFAGSPIMLTDNATGTTVTLAASGTATDGAGVSTWQGLFQVPITGMFPSQIQQFFCPNGTCDFASGMSLSSSQSGDFVAAVTVFGGCTVTQGGWGAPAHGNNPGAFLNSKFSTVYPSGVVTIGGNFQLLFTSPGAIRAFLPQGGPPFDLTANATNPTTSSAGVFAGQVLALQLNVDLKGFGSLFLTGTGTSLDGKTVAQILASANTALGGGALPAGFTFSSLNDLIDKLNSAFDGCVPDSFAAAHLH